MRRTFHKLNTRFLAGLLALFLLLCAMPVAAAQGLSGTCGDSLTWTLDGGTLTITGSGDMHDFTEPDMAPWYSYRHEIYRLVLPDGLTGVGDLAFYECDRLKVVTLPSTVTRVGEYAFALCGQLVLLDLGTGLRTIEEGAFSRCGALPAVQFPDGLQTLGTKCFYRCESLSVITVPASVKKLGTSVFANCKGLISATVYADVDTLPQWMFYACDNLNRIEMSEHISAVDDFTFAECDHLQTVYYGGDAQEEITETLENSVPTFESVGIVTPDKPAEYIGASSSQENEDGSVTQTVVTVVETDFVSVSATIENIFVPETGQHSDYNAEITATVSGEDGWGEAESVVNDALTQINDLFSAQEVTQTVELDIYVKETDALDQAFVEAMAGRDVSMTVTTQNGSTWKLDCSEIDNREPSGQYSFSYTMFPGSGELAEELGAESCFVLQFFEPAQVNAEIMVRLGESFARCPATLYQRLDDELIEWQSVLVDAQGFAHLYLGSVSDETDYYIALDPAQPMENVIIPDELLPEYGDVERIQPIRYEITGRTSSWGLNITQVTWIMIGAIFVCVAAVGVTMFVLNKRKLSRGYVPPSEDEESFV